jgi:hypothetical protein
MPRPKGWTKRQTAKRDRIAKAIIREGGSSDVAWGAATNRVKRERRAGRGKRGGK